MRSRSVVVRDRWGQERVVGGFVSRLRSREERVVEKISIAQRRAKQTGDWFWVDAWQKKLRRIRLWANRGMS